MPKSSSKKGKRPPRKVVIKNPRTQRAVELFEAILDDMLVPPQVQPILIAGDPGSGKTSFVQALSLALDVGLILIEAPHVSPDHIAPIPYYVFREGKLAKQDVSATKDAKAEVQLSKPKLLTDLKREYKRWANTKYRYKRIRSLLQQRFGRTWAELVDKYRDDIEEARKHYKLILFVDEFYRTSTPTVANLLRNLALDKSIHGTPIERGTYVLLATNLGDVGVEEIPDHHTFNVAELEYTPDELKDYWMNTLGISKQAAEDIIQACLDKDGADLITGRDPDSDTFASKRRLTHFAQMYDLALKHGDEDLKRLVATLAYQNFYDPQHEAAHPLAVRLSKLVAEKMGNPEPYTHKEWQNALEAYLKAVRELGAKYKHSLNIYGPPGVGKTAVLEQLTTKLGAKALARYAIPDLSPESTLGIPNVDPNSGETTFDNPPLFDSLRNTLGFTDEEVKQAQEGCPEEDKEIKYIVFLDEISRPQSPKVFNFIRRMLLDRQINDDPRTKLPCGTVVVTAMNPYDESGAVEEMSMHVKDVLDFIPSGVDAGRFASYMHSKLSRVAPWGPAVGEILLGILRDASPGEDSRGKVVPPDERPFWQGVKGSVVWYPPRSVDHLISMAVSRVNRVVNRLRREGQISEDMPLDQQRAVVRDALIESAFPRTFGAFLGQYLTPRVGANVGDAVAKEVAGMVTRNLDAIIEKLDLATVEVMDLLSIYKQTAKRTSATAAGGGLVNLRAWLMNTPEEQKMAQINVVLEQETKETPWPDVAVNVASFFVSLDEMARQLMEAEHVEAVYLPTPSFLESMWQVVDRAMIEKAYKDATYETLTQADETPIIKDKYAKRIDEYRREDYAKAIRRAFFDAFQKGATFKGVPVDAKRLEELFGITIASEED